MLKLDFIIIPTLGRLNRQITYDRMPQKYKDMTVFLVQPHEAEAFKAKYTKNRIDVLPESVKGISPTRQWIFENYSGIYLVADDDMTIKHKERNLDKRVNEFNRIPKWYTTPMIGDSAVEWWDKMFNDLLTFMEKEDAGLVGMEQQDHAPDDKFFGEYKVNRRVQSFNLYNSDLIKKRLPSFSFLRVVYGSDFDTSLQLVANGIKTVLSTAYWCAQDSCAKGGCNQAGRDLKTHNEQQTRLAELWPDFVVLNKTDIGTRWLNSGKCGNETYMCAVTANFKKAYAAWEEKEKAKKCKLQAFFN